MRTLLPTTRFVGKELGDFIVEEVFCESEASNNTHPMDYKIKLKCKKCNTIQTKFYTSLYRKLTFRACINCKVKFNHLLPIWNLIQKNNDPCQWANIDELAADMGVKPKDKKLIRLDSRLPWSKENCIWAKPSKMKGKVLRKGSTQTIINGRVVHCSQVAKICGISRERVRQMLRGLRPTKKGYVKATDPPMSLQQILERYSGGQQWLLNIGIENALHRIQ